MTGLQTASQLESAGQQQSLWWIISILPSEHLLLYSPQRFHSILFPHPSEGFQVWGNFPPSWSPLRGTDACSKSFVSIFPYILPYFILWRLVCLFGSLGSSANFQKVYWRIYFTCRCIFDVAHSLCYIRSSSNGWSEKTPINIIFWESEGNRRSCRDV